MKDEVISVEKLVTFRKKKSQWLNTHILDLGDIFGLTVRAVNVLKPNGVYKLEDLLVYHKRELLNGKPVNVNALTTKYEKCIAEEVNSKRERNVKVGQKSMEEIEAMLKKLNMSLREKL